MIVPINIEIYISGYFLLEVEEVSVEDELSHMSSSHWETEEVYGDLEMDGDSELPEETLKPKKLCQQFTSELKNKLQVNIHTFIHTKRK